MNRISNLKWRWLLAALLLGASVAAGYLYYLGFLYLRLRPPYILQKSPDLQPDGRPVAFVDVNVVPMHEDVILAGQTVIVADGVIRKIGPAAEVAVPAGALVVDGRGRYLMPGLADMHVHVEEENELLLFVANGVTTVRNVWGNDGLKRLMGFPDQLALREQVRRGELFGPTIYTTGPIMDGDPPETPVMPVFRTPAEARQAVARQAAQGYDAIKVYDNLAPDVYQAILAEAAMHGLPVVGHVPHRVGLDDVLAGGQLTIEHLTGYLDPDAATLLIPATQLVAYAQKTAAAGVWNCPTFVIWQKRLPTAHDLTRPELRFISPRMQRIWRTFARQMGQSITYTGDDYAAEMERQMLAITAALHQAGAGLLLGTDTDNAYVIPGFSIHEELAYLVAAGLTPYEALRTGTVNAAAALGRAGEFGTVAVGQRADLILLEANPLADVAHVQQRVGVMLRGQWLPETQLQTLLAELAATYGR